jgi:hypothetical protein
MRKPTYASVGLLLLAGHCGGNEANSLPNTTSLNSGGTSAGGGGSIPSMGGLGTAGSLAGAGGETTTTLAGGSPSADGGAGGIPAVMSGAGGVLTAVGAAGAAPQIEPVGGAAGGSGESGTQVSGHVVGSWDQPIEGVLVAIDGVATTTNSEGAFTFAHVAPTYRVVVLESDERRVQIFEGLRARHPTFLSEGNSTASSTTVSGVVLRPDGSNIDPLHRGLIAFSADGAQKVSAISALHADGTYSFGMDWQDTPTLVGALSALAWSIDSNNVPVAYDGFAAKRMTLARDSIATSADLELRKISTRTLHGVLDIPPGYSADLDYRVGPLSPIQGAAPDANFAYQVPEGTREVCWVSVETTRLTSTGTELSTVRRLITDSTDDIELVVPRAPSLVTPIAQAAGVSKDTIFQWAPDDGAVSVAHFTIGNLSIEVTTTSASLALPDLSAFGVAFPSASAGVWEIRSLSSASNIDDAAEFAFSALNFLSARGEADVARSVQRTFTLD